MTARSTPSGHRRAPPMDAHKQQLKQIQVAARLLYDQKGQFRVAELAEYCSLSTRQLQRQFHDAAGVAPKTLARTIWFDVIRNRLMFDPNANLTELAYEFGY